MTTSATKLKKIHVLAMPEFCMTYWDLVLIEHDVVWVASVVHPGHRVTGLDGHGGGVEDQGTAVSASLDGDISVSSQGQCQGGHSHTSELSNLLQVEKESRRERLVNNPGIVCMVVEQNHPLLKLDHHTAESFLGLTLARKLTWIGFRLAWTRTEVRAAGRDRVAFIFEVIC